MAEHPRVELGPGLTYRQLDYWTRRGLLEPHNGQTPGSGHYRWYPLHEISIAQMVGRLRLEGFELETAFRKAREAHRGGRIPCGTGWPG